MGKNAHSLFTEHTDLIDISTSALSGIFLQNTHSSLFISDKLKKKGGGGCIWTSVIALQETATSCLSDPPMTFMHQRTACVLS